VMVDESSAARGFGFVCFGKPEEAAKALAEMHGKLVFGKPLYVAYAQRKEIRRAQLEAQYAQRQAQYYYQAQATGMPIPGPAIYPPSAAPYYPAGYPPGQRPYVYPPVVRRWGSGAAPPNGGPAVAGAVAPGTAPGGAPAPQGRAAPTSAAGPYATMPNYVMAAGQRARGRPRVAQGQPVPPQAAGPRGPGTGPSARGGSVRFPGNVRSHRPRDSGYPNQQPGVGVAVDPLDPKRLASLGVEDRKRVIGEAMLEIIREQEQVEPDLAKKITGMILSSNEDQTELIHLLEDRLVLSEKVREALEILSKELEPASSS